MKDIVVKNTNMSKRNHQPEPKRVNSFSLSRLLIVVVVVLITALLTAGPIWYFMDQINKIHDKNIQNLQGQLNKMSEILSKSNTGNDSDAVLDETSDWKTYTGKGFSIRYPGSWEYDDTYWLGQDFTMVSFGENKKDLPAHESDQISAISINSGKGEAIASSYQGSDKVKVSEVVIGEDIKATKMVLLPGREDEMHGESKITYYDIKLDDGNYITISNFEDYKLDIFNKMLSTIRLK